MSASGGDGTGVWPVATRAPEVGISDSKAIATGDITSLKSLEDWLLEIVSGFGFTGQLIDNITQPITAAGGIMNAQAQPAITGDWIITRIFSVPPTVKVCFDAVRGVNVLTAGTQVEPVGVDLVNGVAGYVMVQQPISGAFPTSVALFGAGSVDVNGGAVWGINTVLSDRAQGRVLDNTLTGRILYNELDFTVCSNQTVINGLLLAGSSLAQPANATGFAVGWLDNAGGVTARWNRAYYASAGSCDIFAHLSPKHNVIMGGVTSDCQDIQMDFINAGVPDSYVITALAGGNLQINKSSGPGTAITTNQMFQSEALIARTFDTAAPVAGGTVTMSPRSQGLVINPAGTLATLTIKLPPNATNGQRVSVGSTQQITAVTWQDGAGNAGNVIGSTPTLPVGRPTSFISINNQWFPM